MYPKGGLALADKTTPGGVLHDPVNGKRLDEPSAVNLEARLREVSSEAGAAMAAATRPQFADNGDGTITLTTSATITDAGDGTLTIGA